MISSISMKNSFPYSSIFAAPVIQASVAEWSAIPPLAGGFAPWNPTRVSPFEPTDRTLSFRLTCQGHFLPWNPDQNRSGVLDCTAKDRIFGNCWECV